MPAVPKIIRYGVEPLVLDLRKQGKGTGWIVDAVNDELAHRGIDDKINDETVRRYLKSLDKTAAPALHRPDVADENARLSINFAERLQRLDALLGTWIEDAATAERVEWVHEQDDDGEQTTKRVVTADWQARSGMAREMREHLKAYADLMARIYDAQQVQAFQQSVTEAIAEASPEVAQRVLDKLRAKQDARRAALFGN